MKRISEHLLKQLVKTGYFIGRRFVIHKKTYTSHFCNEKKNEEYSPISACRLDSRCLNGEVYFKKINNN